VNAEATIEMESHISLSDFSGRPLKRITSRYSIFALGDGYQPKEIPKKEQSKNGTGTFYCPMHCEGDKTYNSNVGCPVCGMDLVEEQNLSKNTSEQWTCPMHPEVIKDESGACPRCGMDLVPMEADSSAEEKSYKKLLKKFWIATAFTLPIFLIAMSEMVPNNLIIRFNGTETVELDSIWTFHSSCLLCYLDVF